MKSLVISPKNTSDLKLISEMLIPVLELSDEEKEDIVQKLVTRRHYRCN
jgi:hypothetical protein